MPRGNMKRTAESEEGERGSSSPSPAIFHDPWLTADGPALHAVAADALKAALQVSSPKDGRTRKPKPSEAETQEMIADNVVAALAHLHLTQPAGTRLAVDLAHSKLTRYDRPGFGQLPIIITKLESAGLILRHPSTFKRLRTTLEPSATLKAAFEAHKVSLSDIGRAAGEESIVLVLRGGSGDAVGDDQEERDDPASSPPTRYRRQLKTRIDYQDTDQSREFRSQMTRVNGFLCSSNITLLGEPQARWHLTRRFLTNSRDEPQAFNLNGRIFGGFWQNLPRERRGALRIGDGEPVADLDYAGMVPHLLFARIGKRPPPGDLYAIRGFEDYREGAKKALNALIFSRRPLRQAPSGVKAHLPPGMTMAKAAQLIGDHHPDLAPFFGRDIGVSLMFTESQVLVAVLLRLIDLGVPFLPMHDGGMSPVSRRETVRRVMEEEALRVTGVPLPVVEKPLGQ